jgi:transposase
MIAEDAAPGTGIPGQRLIEGNACNSNSLRAVFNAICDQARSYDALIDFMRETKPRLLPDSVDYLLGRLISAQVVRLGDDLRWSRRWL